MKFLLILIFLLITLFSCSSKKDIPQPFVNAVEEIKNRYAPDQRISIFNIDYSHEKNLLIIKAETDNYDALEDLISAAENLLEKDTYQLQISKLPSPDLGDSTFALVRVSTANIRRKPNFSAEIIDQSIMGTELKVLKKNGSWFLIQTPYNYLGWMKGGYITRLSRNDLELWQTSKKLQIKSNFAQVFLKPNSNSTIISDAVFGSVFKFVSKTGHWYKIKLPDARIGYIDQKFIDNFVKIDNSAKIDPIRLVNTAIRFLGTPYFWGGNSSKGLDCSGFTQTVYRNQGYLLPRDANMQVKHGINIEYYDTFDNVKKGDLLFFSPNPNESKITHVGLSLGGYYFIHAGSPEGEIRINSFKKGDENYTEYRYERLRQIKRIINN